MMPRICSKKPRTRAGAMRQYRALLADYKRRYDGGGMFGFDWATWRANDPAGHAKARALVQYMSAE